MKHPAVLFLTLFSFLTRTGAQSAAQPPQPSQPDQRVFTSDIDHFWIAYDSTLTTTDSVQQLYYVQTLYVDKGTPGLKAFMEERGYTAPGWVNLLRQDPKFWRSIRPNTLKAKSFSPVIEAAIRRFKTLYPPLTSAKLYFTIGGASSGGTTQNSMVLIGTEVAAGDGLTDVSEPDTRWLAGYLKDQKIDNIVPLNIHEYVHTQQDNSETRTLLAASLHEGAADFITEVVMGKPRKTNYIDYGLAHEAEVKKEFEADMFTGATTSHWLYNGTRTDIADLGYFMGYAICGSYYRHAIDKKQAIRDIIQLHYGDTTATENFLRESHYFTEPYDKAALLADVKKRVPEVSGLTPSINADTTVDPTLTQLTIHFSLPMIPGNYSISRGEEGTEYPITKVIGYGADNRSLTVEVALKPGHVYEFTCTGRNFRTPNNYTIQPYKVHFKTRP